MTRPVCSLSPPVGHKGGGSIIMARTMAKLVAIPASMGIVSFRVYAMSEDKTTDVLLSPRELSIYSQDPSAACSPDKRPGLLERGLGVVRVGLQPYVRALKNGYSSAKFGAVTVYTAGHDTYEFLRSPPPGFIPRVSVITVSGLAGLILARKGSRLKRIGVSLGLAALGAGVCYPTQTVCVVKVTGQKIYAGSQYTSSSVVSMFKSKSPPTVIPENHALQVLVTDPEVYEAKHLPETETPEPATSESEFPLHNTTDWTHTEGCSDTEPSAGVLETTAVLEQEEVQNPSAEEAAPAPPAENVASPLVPVLDTEPLSETSAIEEVFPATVDGVASSSPVDEPAPPPAPVDEASELLPDHVDEEAAAPPPAPFVVEEAAAPPPVDEAVAAPAPAPVGAEATPTRDDEVETPAPPPAPVVEEATAPVSAAPSVVVVKTPGKPRFAPEIVDLGQANPEDADLYSTRG
ncbi:hypothetical protein DPEC_G00231700 [Dallia pectoralis]|uniref:Uncharacterized protein n=1 Tax=Dallia pectoralis TaxID=75939 RepID=A0ACC2FWY4_DALPE|nr:hypothetical protein DPEC_G00231700 [Dallia pectoralis]